MKVIVVLEMYIDDFQLSRKKENECNIAFWFAIYSKHLIVKIDTFPVTCTLFSCMFIMASEILTSMGSITDSMLNGPSSLSATKSMASVKEQMSQSLDNQ